MRMTISPTTPYILDDLTCFITNVKYNGEFLDYQGNGLWEKDGVSAQYLGPEAATYRDISSDWTYIGHVPTNFTDAYPTIGLPIRNPGDTTVMTWTLRMAGFDPSHYIFSVQSELFANVPSVPEPSSALVLLSGLGALALRKRKHTL